MASVTLRCGKQTDDTRPGRNARQAGGTPAPEPAPRRPGSCSLQARVGSPGQGVGVTVNFSARSLAAVAGLAQSAVQLGSDGVQLVEDAAEAAADVAGAVLEKGVMAGVVGAALVGVLA